MTATVTNLQNETFYNFKTTLGAFNYDEGSSIGSGWCKQGELPDLADDLFRGKDGDNSYHKKNTVDWEIDFYDDFSGSGDSPTASHRSMYRCLADVDDDGGRRILTGVPERYLNSKPCKGRLEYRNISTLTPPWGFHSGDNSQFCIPTPSKSNTSSRKPAVDDVSTSIAAESYDSGPPSPGYDKPRGKGGGLLTTQAPVYDRVLVSDGQAFLEKDAARELQNQNQLFESILNNGISSGQDIDGLKIGPQAKEDSSDLMKANAKSGLAIAKVEVIPGRAPASTREPRTPSYRCATQSRSISSVFVNVRDQGCIHRWAPGSIITYNVNYRSFFTPSDATHAIKCIEEAAKLWNERLKPKAVQFQRVPDDKPAVFQVMFERWSPGKQSELARAFFPGDVPEEQFLKVYSPSFNKEEGNYDYLANVFCHELGHVLGLRHEFAQASPEEKQEPSLLLGERNRLSIMNYHDHPRMMQIQESDGDGVRRLYEARGNDFNGHRIIDETPRHFTPPSWWAGGAVSPLPGPHQSSSLLCSSKAFSTKVTSRQKAAFGGNGVMCMCQCLAQQTQVTSVYS
ncbi:uncharacterized protein F4822DRAFT_441479 [Hypoxylon trugodes]|uniref:uncharacterized protein n=1 Tax=Hypoxylon trugodes TaxID=326681 RepID=UPI002198466C|nr:uncharacterized protein F4822DRAFT_441479 [Hypoxylon trugodes]KAI1392587.1 hypothetical protein F4822DRAFT_441479 [Hypoxylon trugodes]